MFVGYVIVAVILAAILVISGRGKLVKDERIVASISRANVPLSWYPPLAACEIAGAVGLIVGIWWPPLGIAAAIGVVLYFLGAVTAHVRAGDIKGIMAPLPLLALAAVALVLRILA